MDPINKSRFIIPGHMQNNINEDDGYLVLDLGRPATRNLFNFLYYFIT